MSSPWALPPGVPELPVVKIADLADENGLVEYKKFERQQIRGPAVIAPLEGVEFIGSHFVGPGGPRGIFWEAQEGKPMVGVIGLRRVAFRDCVFVNIGIAATPEFIERFLTNTAAVGYHEGDPPSV
jgi:hypothetical protein